MKRQGWPEAAGMATRWIGSVWAILVLVAFTAAWVAVGFLTGFTKGWELTLTASTPVLSLLLLVAVLHTQNHDNQAMQLKLDELIRAVEGSSNAMMRVEEASAEDLERLTERFRREAGREQASHR